MWWKFRKEPKGAPSQTASAPTPEIEDTGELRAAGRAPLSEVAKKVKHVEVITKRKSSAMLAGEYKSRFKGQGMQFADSRVYQYGDDIRHIDWRTTARMQEAYVKTFEEERELLLMLAVDVSASSDFGSTGTSKRENLALALACIGFSAIENNDRVGLILFSDRVERYVPPRKGRKHILRLIDELLTFEPISRKSDFSPALNFLSSVLKHGAVVILASDFFAKLDKKKLQLLAKKHDFVCLRATDPRDGELPDVGLLQIEDPETGESVLLATSSSQLRKEYRAAHQAARTRTEQTLKKSGAALVDLDTADDPAKVLQQFFHSRKGPTR